MYKIFLNQFCISFLEKPDDTFTKLLQNPTKKDIKKLSRKIKRRKIRESVGLIHSEPKWLFKQFIKQFLLVQAAGGLVFNDADAFLAILRLGKWDLPKGKLQPGEKKRKAAVREVEEECGITSPRIIRKLQPTFHIFKGRRGRWILKKSDWYEMKYHGNEKLVPETKEDIEHCEWISSGKISMFLENTYPGMKEFLVTELNLSKKTNKNQYRF